MTGTTNPSGVGTPVFYGQQTSAGVGIASDISADPGNVNAPIFYEPPSILTGGNAVLWIIATGVNANWGGAQVWASIDGGSSYGLFGAVVVGGVQGLLTAILPSHVDPDTTNTLSVDLTMSRGTLLSGSQIDADLGVTLCYVDGELVAYETATLTSAFHYNLTYLRRGFYASPIGSHAIGTQFGRFTQTTMRQQYPANWVGQTVLFKFASFNKFGAQTQDISTLTPYSYMLNGNGLGTGGGNANGCPVDIVLAAGASEDWGLLGSVLSSSCDWGKLSDAVVSLRIDEGIINQ